jgi:hypothetical protein
MLLTLFVTISFLQKLISYSLCLYIAQLFHNLIGRFDRKILIGFLTFLFSIDPYRSTMGICVWKTDCLFNSQSLYGKKRKVGRQQTFIDIFFSIHLGENLIKTLGKLWVDLQSHLHPLCIIKGDHPLLFTDTTNSSWCCSIKDIEVHQSTS